jgi:hypothetical protein
VEFFVEEKQKNVVQGEATFVDLEADCLKMEDVIADAKHEVSVFQIEEKTICRQLEDMTNKWYIFLAQTHCSSHIE